MQEDLHRGFTEPCFGGFGIDWDSQTIRFFFKDQGVHDRSIVGGPEDGLRDGKSDLSCGKFQAQDFCYEVVGEGTLVGHFTDLAGFDIQAMNFSDDFVVVHAAGSRTEVIHQTV